MKNIYSENISEIDLEEHPHLIQYVSHQTEELCLIALKKDPECFQYIVNQTPLVVSTALTYDPHNLQYVFRQTKDIILHAVRGRSSALKYADFQDDDIVIEAFTNTKETSINNVKHIRNLSTEIGLKLIKIFGGETLKFIRKQNDELVIAAMLHDWNAVKYAHEKSPLVVATAIEIDPLSLKYFTDLPLSSFLYERAVTKNGLALNFIENQNDALAKLAIIQNPDSLRYVKDQTDEIIQLAIDANPFTVKHVRNVSEDIAIRAITKIPEIINHFDWKQTEAMILAAVSLNGLLLESVHFQNRKIVSTALNNNPLAFEFIHNQTIDDLRFAVTKHPSLYQFSKIFDKNLAVFAFSRCPGELRHKMNHPDIDDDLLKEVLKVNGMALSEIPQRKTYDMELIAVKQNWRALQFVSDLTEEICVSSYDQDIRSLYFMWNKLYVSPLQFEDNMPHLDMVKSWDIERQMQCAIYSKPSIASSSRKRMDIF